MEEHKNQGAKQSVGLAGFRSLQERDGTLLPGKRDRACAHLLVCCKQCLRMDKEETGCLGFIGTASFFIHIFVTQSLAWHTPVNLGHAQKPYHGKKQ